MSQTQKPLVVVPADAPLQIAESPQLDRLRGLAEVRVHRSSVTSSEELLQRTKEAHILINSRGLVKWPGELLRQLPNLRLITTCSIGTDSIDLQAASRQGVMVSNIPGETAPVVAEHTLALMLAVAKRLAFQTQQLKAGHWTAMQNMLLSGKTLAVIGTGAIGSQVARLGRALGMRVIAWTFHPSAQRAAQLDVQFVELDELLRSADVVSIHVKLTSQSRHLIGSRELGLMKPGSILINTARGGIVDIQSLVASLQSGHLAGAGLDVFDEEPLPVDHPILQCPQVVLSPHHADQTPEGMELLNAGAVDNVIAFLNGTPQNVVT